jgi:hypothetical protein
MYWKYFKYILEHKKNVFIECMKIAFEHRGKIRRQLIVHAFTHDMSKFLPCEFIPYAKYFYGNEGIELEKHWDYEALNNGHSCLSGNYLRCKNKFNKAWEHHYKHNKHHEDYWKEKTIPYLYMMQLIADWKGMSRKFGDTAQEYYLKNYHKFNMTYQTRLNLEMNLNVNPSPYHNYGHTLEDFANMYDEQTYNNSFDWLKDKYKIDTYKLLKE